MSWKALPFGKKIAVGFSTVLTLLVVVGALSFTGIGGIVTNAEQVIEGNKLDGTLAQREVDHLNWVNQVNALLTDDKVVTLDVETDDHKCGFGKWLYGEGRKHAEQLVPSLAPLLKAIEAPHMKLHESAIEIAGHFKQADLELGNFLREKKTDHLSWAHRVKDVFVDTTLTEIKAETDPQKCSLGRWMYAPETEALKQAEPQFAALWSALEAPHSALHGSAVTIQKMLDAGEREEARAYYMNHTKPLAYQCLEKIDAILSWHDGKVNGMKKANGVYATQTVPALGEIQNLLNRIRTETKANIMTDQAMLAAAQGTKRNVAVVCGVAIVAGVLLAFVIARGVVTTLQRIAGQIDVGAEQVASAAEQVTGAAQSLAQGSSEQAAGIEETSSSLEEMSSMTRQNAENATQADALMKEANRVVSDANEAMTELTGSMAEVSRASEETSKIIKTIDEIAFQTNLLALNAAVEAARAGEAGAGFAVVADEVRNLAMRAADAAKTTAELIEGTVKKINEGSALVGRTNTAFAKVADSAARVGELVGEISAASSEQSQGIEQVNNAVAEIDKITQQNAATAEESASAAEEMHGQASSLKSGVDELMKLVNCGNGDREVCRSAGRKYIQNRRAAIANTAPAARGRARHIAAQSAHFMDPARAIPLEDGEFGDF